MSLDAKTQLAVELLRLGVSQDGVVELLSYGVDRIEAQLAYLPYRKAKRPEAMIVEAIRNNYSAPKDYFYAQAKAELAPALDALDQDPEYLARQAAANPQGHRTPDSPAPDPTDCGLAEGGPGSDHALPYPDAAVGSGE